MSEQTEQTERSTRAPTRARLCRRPYFARLVDLVGTRARPLAAGAGAVPGAVQLVGVPGVPSTLAYGTLPPHERGR